MTKLSNPLINSLLENPLDFIHFIDEIPMGVLVLDLNQRVVHLNKSFEALSGEYIDRAYGVKCHNILRSAACVNNCPLLLMGSENRSISCKSDIINMDRQKLPIRITIAPMLDINGDVKGFIETIQDLRMVEKLDQRQSIAYSFANIIGRSPQMEKIFQTLPLLAQSDTSILITGETGTGKDLVAEAIHQTSEREASPFIKINCGALPETLLESEIFGHEKGAFTGAVGNKPGRFKLAHNGTIFLTEIGDLPLALQVKLLTFLDDKIIFPLGSTKEFNVNVRMIAATNRNLEEMVKEGSFRKDLLFRLNVARIHLPPLREREGDIRLLLDHFFSHYTKQVNKAIKGFSTAALARLIHYNYEGNIRELKNIVEYAVNVAATSVIEPENLPAYLFEPVTDTHSFSSYSGSFKNFNASNPMQTEDIASKPDKIQSNETWPSVQRRMILDALKEAKGKKSEAASILGMGRSTLWRKIKQYNIDP
ncbi:MAG: sigma 54-interacting transcriptional regulator [Deltaproteobacteria bacterium]|jgi:two-component system response regulator AtoC|nr:sigma 54-interacting transcriptional regulator [Deltaproteobacteria bacterium]